MINKDYERYNEYWQIIAENTGYDFSGYSLKSLQQRLERFISYECIGSADELREKIYSDRISQEKILGKLLSSNTELFRDASFFLALKNTVLPHLAIYPKINIWVAGCSTGEEAYSLAIFLDELKLLDRCNIIATDIDQINLNTAEAAIYPLLKARACSMRYYKAGGKLNLSDYYTVYYEQIIFHDHLRSKIKFLKQDIFKETPTGRFHLVLCRNLLTYFTERIQYGILGKISNRLYNYGYFCSGLNEFFNDTESLDISPTDKFNNIYRKFV
jgi:chemotaxis protein methyltransferase CheR